MKRFVKSRAFCSDGIVLQCPGGMLPAQREERANSGRDRGALSALLKQGNGAIHLFLSPEQIDHEPVGRVIRLRGLLLAELRCQQGGPADTDGRALGITLSHGVLRLRLEP